MESQLIRLRVNGEEHDVVVSPNETLVEVLRDRLELTGTKMGCGEGACGKVWLRVRNSIRCRRLSCNTGPSNAVSAPQA